MYIFPIHKTRYRPIQEIVAVLIENCVYRWLQKYASNVVNMDSGNGLLPNGKLSEPMLNSHQWGSVTFPMREQCHTGSAQAAILYNEFESDTYKIMPNLPGATELTIWGILPANHLSLATQIAKFMGPTWGPPGSCRPHVGPMLAPWTLLSG